VIEGRRVAAEGRTATEKGERGEVMTEVRQKKETKKEKSGTGK
jgi:hypothetical protein